jgi:hypothetical protein
MEQSLNGASLNGPVPGQAVTESNNLWKASPDHP